MKTTSFRRALVPGVAALALALTACGSGDEDTDGAGGGDASVADLSGELTAGGATSQESAQNAWRVGFSEVAPGVTINYDPTGSGTGRENFASGGFAFAGSDAYLTDEEGELSAATEQCGGEPIQIPNYVSPIAVVFNVEGVEDLRLSPDTLAGIFAGKIKKWNAEQIVADNPDASLPDADIIPVHRADDSGTTENFTAYLDAVAGDVWTHGAIETWPGEAGGEAGDGTSGVVKVVTDNANTIGYADASQAGGLGQAEIGVGDEFVGPTPEAAAAIIGASPRVDEASAVNLAVDIDHTTTEAGVYPIVLASYLLACEKYEDENTANMVRGYLEYILSDEGQEMGASEAGSAPLSDELQAQAQEIVAKISAG